jgi:hypothetical protein
VTAGDDRLGRQAYISFNFRRGRQKMESGTVMPEIEGRRRKVGGENIGHDPIDLR